MTYTDQETKETYQVIDCKACDGSGLAEWHLGCGDSGPPDCHKCDGIGQYPVLIATPNNQPTNQGPRQ